MEKRFGYCLIVEVQYSTFPVGKVAGHACSHPRMPRAHQAGFSRRFLAGVGLSESVRCHGPGLALLTNGAYNNNINYTCNLNEMNTIKR
ncbi:hypothetical protein TNCV_1159861 [Trichonephila clavipes]|nr:hypothetical protein TNCV_1159861 [Trichonephila clavipes]